MQLREIKIKPKEQDIGKRRASLAGQASPARGEATTRSKATEAPRQSLPGIAGADTPPTTQVQPTSPINAVSTRKMIK